MPATLAPAAQLATHAKTPFPGAPPEYDAARRELLEEASEMTKEMADTDQDPRDAPDIASLWSILDLTPDGRGTVWYPKLQY